MRAVGRGALAAVAAAAAVVAAAGRALKVGNCWVLSTARWAVAAVCTANAQAALAVKGGKRGAGGDDRMGRIGVAAG